MNHEDIELTKTQTLGVTLKALEEALPWKRFLAWIALSTINHYYISEPFLTPTLYAVRIPELLFSFIALPVGEFLIGVIVACIVISIYDHNKELFKTKFQAHKEKVQKEVLENCEQEMLR